MRRRAGRRPPPCSPSRDEHGKTSFAVQYLFSSPSCCEKNRHVCRVKKKCCPGYLAFWTYFLCCTLFRSQLVWVTRRLLLQPSVRLISVKAPPVHFSNKPMVCLAGQAAIKLIFVFHFAPMPHIRCVMRSPVFTLSGQRPNLVKATET